MAKRGRKPKAENGQAQPMLNDDPAFERNAKIEKLATQYEALRDERQSVLEQELELKEKLIKAMKDENLEVYSFDGKMVVLEHIDEDNVKVKKKRAAKESATAA